VNPQSLVGQDVSGNKESKQNDRCSGSYESPSDPCQLVKRKRSCGPHDENYVSEDVYEH
jgi:hypothetical protein